MRVFHGRHSLNPARLASDVWQLSYRITQNFLPRDTIRTLPALRVQRHVASSDVYYNRLRRNRLITNCRSVSRHIRSRRVNSPAITSQTLLQELCSRQRHGDLTEIDGGFWWARHVIYKSKQTPPNSTELDENTCLVDANSRRRLTRIEQNNPRLIPHEWPFL